MPEVSIIIPVHNGRRHIKSCIKSIQLQSFKDLEIIIVNDASTDDSIDICNRFAENDRRIKIIQSPKNEGPYNARITGIKIASGNYMTFVDCDDYIAHDAISHMINHARKIYADIAITGHCYSFTPLNIHAMYNKAIKKLPSFMDENQIKTGYMSSFLGNDDLIPVSMCAKLYSAELLHRQWAACNLKWGEDRIFSLQAFHYAKKCVVIPEYGYYYRWGGSTCRHDILDYLKYDLYMEQAAKIAVDLGYDSLIPLLQSRNNDYFLYHIRNCILDSKNTRQEILNIICAKTKCSFSKAEELYAEQLAVIKRHLPRYITRLVLDRL